ncbi:hypothetical protein KL912_005028 [Ogataea haglerorum]|nr:hypothetical protein KL912_005028 [Ogataea haglerorum]
MSCDHSFCPIVFIRSADRHITNEDPCTISWSSQQLNILRGIVERITSPKDHPFSVTFNFTELSNSWQISKDRIYAKIIELYYIRDTSTNDLDLEDSSSANKQIRVGSLLSDKKYEMFHPIRELELLKFNSPDSNLSHTAEFHYRQSSISGQNPFLGIGSPRLGPLEPDNLNSGSSDGSDTNLAVTSIYLYRSKFIHRETPNQINQSDYDIELENNGYEYLLAGTAESLSKSLLEQELLDRI